MKVLHFTGKGYGEMDGVTEYIVIIEIDEDEDGQCAPGFELYSSTEVDLPSSLPLNTTLVPKY